MALRQAHLGIVVVAGLLVGCSALLPELPAPSADDPQTPGLTPGVTPGAAPATIAGAPGVTMPPIPQPTVLPSVLATPLTALEPFRLHVPVLMYHRIRCVGEEPGPKTNPSLRICPELFEEQLTALRDDGWHSISADELADLMAQRHCPAPKTFVISIDDGAVDGYDNAAPIMERVGFRGTFYLIANRDAVPRRITWDQARDLLARGHAIGNHSWSHRSIGRGDPRELYVEIEQAQQEFETQLGFRPRTFVYPYGSYGPGAIRQLQESWLELAFTTEPGGTHSTETPLVSPRVRIKPTIDATELVRWLQKWADPCAAEPRASPQGLAGDEISRALLSRPSNSVPEFGSA